MKILNKIKIWWRKKTAPMIMENPEVLKSWGYILNKNGMPKLDNNGNLLKKDNYAQKTQKKHLN